MMLDDVDGAATALSKATTWRDLVSVYTQAIANVRQGIDSANAAIDGLNAAFVLGGSRLDFRITVRGRGPVSLDADHIIDNLRRNAWYAIVERLELHRMMSITKWEELQGQLQKGELPDLTEANVRAFARQYETQLPEMLTEMVTEVFDWLRPRREGHGPGRYKTNGREEVRRRVVLTGMVRPWDRLHSGSWRLSWYGEPGQQLIAMENVLNALDGRGSIAKMNQSALQMAIEASKDGKGETELFRFRAFRNGNLHLEFRRLDLLARFNQIAGGKRLKKGSEAA